VGVAVAVSALSVQLIEQPVRHSQYLAAVPWRSLSLGVVTCVVVIGVGLDLRSSVGRLDGGVAAESPELVAAGTGGSVASMTSPAAGSPPTVSQPAAAPPSESGPADTVGGSPTVTVPDTIVNAAVPATLATPEPPSGSLGQLVASSQRLLQNAAAPAPVPSNLNPPLASARTRSEPYQDGCVNVGTNSDLQPCEYGDTSAARTILLYGDSHAVQWFEPVLRIADARGYRLVVLAKAGCPVAEVVVPTPVLRYTCPPYRDRVMAWIERNDPDLVVAANSYTQYPSDATEWAAGTEATVTRLAAASANVVLIGDNPASVEDPPACLSSHLEDASACATSRDDAVLPERISAEVVATRNHDVTFVDTTDWFCTDEVCPPVIGNVLVMRDETHITVPMAEFLFRLVEAAVVPALAGRQEPSR